MVSFRLHKSLLLLIVISVSAALLVWLGILQYHWLGQISETDHERRRAALRLAASRFSEDFDRELARAFVSFQLDSETLRRQKWENYSARYDLWLSQSPFPQLVSEIYLLTSERERRIQAARYDHGARRFESVEPPDDLRRWIESRRNAFRAGGNFNLPAIGPVDGHLPALVIPLLQAPHTQQGWSHPAGLQIEEVGKIEVDCVVVMLNQELIRQAIIPLLAKRHFSDPSGQGEMDYNLIVTSRRPPRIQIYPSAQKAPDEEPQTSDATVGLFSLRPDWITNFASGAGTVGPPGIIQPPNFVAHGSTPRLTTIASGENFPTHEVSGFAAGGGQVTPEPILPSNGNHADWRRSLRSSNGDPSEWRLSLRSSDGDPSEWRLSLRHRAGSLETAVSQLQGRNLMISFGILLLLAVNMALIIISSQRERRLARQQMEFVAGVSHELRTPVSAVCLASANLADGLVHNHQLVKDYGAMINREGRRLAAAVEQALDFAGTEFIKKPYHFRPLAAAELIERALAAIKSQADEKKFEIEKEIEAGLPAVMADSAAIERAVNNLLGNAIKYSCHGRRLKLILHAVGREVQITVEDYGLGIDASDLPHIFKPFYRGRAAVKANIQGNGLGLCLVERIAKAHGGKVSVKSAVGRGSRFTLHLPAIIDNPEAVQKNSRSEHEQSSVVG
jgi:signal transduction histidine kinase